MIEWHTFVDDERLCVKVEFWRRAAFVHCTLRKPVSGMRAARGFFQPLIAMLRAVGHRALYAVVEGERPMRFCEVFGMRRSKRFGDLTLMVKEI